MSTRAAAVSDTGLGRAAFHCYPVPKVIIGCISILLSWRKRWSRADLKEIVLVVLAFALYSLSLSSAAVVKSQQHKF